MSLFPTADTEEAHDSKSFNRPRGKGHIRQYLGKSAKVPTKFRKAFKKHLKCDFDESFLISKTFPGFYKLQIWKAVNVVLDEVVAVVDFDCKTNKRCPPTFVMVKTDCDTSDLALQQGCIFGRYKDVPIMLQISVDSYDNLFLQTYAQTNEEFYSQLLTTLANRSEEFSPYRGKKMIYTGYNRLDFLKPTPITLDDIILDDETANLIKDQFIFPLKKRSNLREAGLPLRRGLLIDGKPGTGKTLFGKALMNECSEATMIFVTARSLVETSDISHIFDYARALQSDTAPTIIIFEDIDLIGAHRDINYSRNMLGELLTQFDGVADNQGIYVIGTTNNKAVLDNALSARPGRFDMVIEFKLPSPTQRQKLVSMYNYGIDSSLFQYIVESTKDFTPAQIKELMIKTKISEIADSKKITEAQLAKLIQYTANTYVGSPYS
jgi:hypothetical protein